MFTILMVQHARAQEDDSITYSLNLPETVVLADGMTFEEYLLKQVLADWFSKQEALPGLFVNGQKTLGENIGDNGGIQVAYRAFENRIKQEPLQTIDGFTPAQRFYLAYARMWASNITPEFLARVVNSDVHSPHVFRVNAALPMIDSWYDAFGILPTDKMYIPKEKRALIW